MKTTYRHLANCFEQVYLHAMAGKCHTFFVIKFDFSYLIKLILWNSHPFTTNLTDFLSMQNMILYTLQWRDSSVTIVNRFTSERRRIRDQITTRKKADSSLFQEFYTIYTAHSASYQRVTFWPVVNLPRNEADRSDLARSLRTCVAIPPFPHRPSWHAWGKIYIDFVILRSSISLSSFLISSSIHYSLEWSHF